MGLQGQVFDIVTGSGRPAAPLVCVVIPAFNATPTLDETLRSVRGQTWPALEIIVVDDGSTDGTPDLVLAHRADDPRVRLVRQQNGGVARARNRGIEQTRAEFVAPVDSDDLWAPTKIEKQMAVMAQGGPDLAVVYCWFSLIDEESRVTASPPFPAYEGDVLVELARINFIGNGSSPLMRRAAVLDVGGYDPGLRDAGAQGCEDSHLYLRLAMRHRFGVVPEYLLGYREGRYNMSSDVSQMVRSWRMVSEAVGAERPDLVPDLNDNERAMITWLYRRSCDAHRPKKALAAIRWAFNRNPDLGWKLARECRGRLQRYVSRRFRGPPPTEDLPLFLDAYASNVSAAADMPR